MRTDQLREMIVNQLLLLRDKSFGRQRNPFGSHRAAPPNGVHLQQLLISCEPVMRFPPVSCFCLCSFSSPPLQVVLIYPYLQRPPESVPRNPNAEKKTINMGGGDAPCGACKFLRRKCVKGCVFAPYFCSEEMGASRFGAIHKVFGASNFSKLLMHLPVEHRDDAVVSVLYEAEARLQDPVYGCVSHIYALQQQVANLKGKLAAGYAQLADCSDSDRASLSPANDQYSKHSEMPSLTSNSNSSSPCDKQYLNPWGLPQQIPSDDVAINNYNEGLWSSYSVCMQGSIHPLSTAQETHVFQDGEGLFEQRHPINNSEDGDLQDFVLAVLRRNR